MSLLVLPMQAPVHSCGHEGEASLLAWLACDADDCDMTSPMAGKAELATEWARRQGWTIDGTVTLCPTHERVT